MPTIKPIYRTDGTGRVWPTTRQVWVNPSNGFRIEMDNGPTFELPTVGPTCLGPVMAAVALVAVWAGLICLL